MLHTPPRACECGVRASLPALLAVRRRLAQAGATRARTARIVNYARWRRERDRPARPTPDRTANKPDGAAGTSTKPKRNHNCESERGDRNAPSPRGAALASARGSTTKLPTSHLSLLREPRAIHCASLTLTVNVRKRSRLYDKRTRFRGCPLYRAPPSTSSFTHHASPWPAAVAAKWCCDVQPPA